MEKIKFSEWATPVVVVTKKQLCEIVQGLSDYPQSSDGCGAIPLPRSEEIFATLVGGKYFSVLDLSNAYQQLLLEDESRKFVAINTHHGLYQYTRLPFGVTSAPAMFQKTMTMILQGIDGVKCYIDNRIRARHS